MNCPHCNIGTYVKQTRTGKHSIRRRRECPNCQKRFTTHETMINPKTYFAILKQLDPLQQLILKIQNLEGKK